MKKKVNCMKRLSISILSFLLYSTSVLFSLSNEKIKKLGSDECFNVDYKDGILYINKKTEEYTEPYYKYECTWGAWQISEDKRKILLYSKGMNEIYLLDGNTGLLSFKGDFQNSSFPSADFRYLISSRLEIDLRMRTFIIYDLDSMEELYKIPWLSQRDNFLNSGVFTFGFYRSLDPKYDFEIYAIGETGEAFGNFLLNASTKEFEENNFSTLQTIPNKSMFECGWE